MDVKGVLFADFESNTDVVSSVSTNVNLWALVDGDNVACGVELDNFMKRLFDYEKASVYFHNLSFDGQFILQGLLNNGFEINNRYQVSRSKKSVTLLADGNRFYQIKIVNYNSVITLLCSMRLFNIPVSALGEILGFKKGDGIRWFDKFALVKDKDLKRGKKKNNNPDGVINYYSNLRQFRKILQEQGYHVNGNFDFDKTCGCYQCYCIRDVFIVRDYYKVFVKKLKPSLTISSTAKKTMANYLINSSEKDNNMMKLRTIYLKIFGQRIMKVSSWKKYQSSYYGGFVSYNHEKPVLNVGVDGYSADVNSMYPSVMVSKIAIGELRESKDYYVKNKLSYEKMIGVVVSEIHIKKGKPAIGPSTSKISGMLKQDEKYCNAPFNERKIYHWKGSAFYMFWEREGNYIKDCYDGEGYVSYTGYVQTTDAFKYYINKYYKLKIDADNVSERSVYKLLLNSIYGKLGEKIERDEHIYFDFKKRFNGELLGKTKNYDKTIASRKVSLLKYLHEVYKRDVNLYYEKIKNRRDLVWYDDAKTITKILIHCRIKDNINGYEIKKLSSIVSASYITMLARVELYKVIIPNFSKWLYADTDSVYFSVKPRLNIDNKKLGAGKWEKRFSKIKILRAKVYSVEQTHEWVKDSGVAKYIPFGSQKTSAISGHKIANNQIIKEADFERGKLNPRLQNQGKIVKGGVLIKKIEKKL